VKKRADKEMIKIIPRLNSKIIAVIVTISVIAILFYTGPAQAIKLGLEIPKSNILVGSSINMMPTIEIEPNELPLIDYIILEINGHTDIQCKFLPNGTAISGCDDIKIQKLESDFGSNFGYGYGYRFVDSYGYGYGYGFSPGFLKYNITVNRNDLIVGNYSTKMVVVVGDKSFEFLGDMISILKRLPPQKLDNRCSIRAFDGNFNVDNKDFSNNRLKFYLSPRDSHTIDGTGSISGQKDRDRFTYRFKIANVIDNNATNLILNISGVYRIGRDGELKNVKESAILNFDRVNNKIAINGEKITIKIMSINFIEGCDSIKNIKVTKG
jgi:hypothetical protein